MAKSAAEKSSFPELYKMRKDRISVVGEIPYKAEWFPEGNYKGDANELKQKLPESKIKLVYFPEVDSSHIMACLPQIHLPSGFEAVVCPTCVHHYMNIRDPNLRSISAEQQMEVNPKHGSTFYSFMESKNIGNHRKKEITLEAENIQKRFEGKHSFDGSEYEAKGGLGTMRIRGTIGRLFESDIKKLLHLLEENKFDGCNLHTHTVYTSASKWRPLIASCELKDSSKHNIKSRDDFPLGAQFYFTYRSRGVSSEERNTEIGMYPFEILTGNDLEMLEKMTVLF